MNDRAHKKWSEAELEYLCEYWGKVSLPGICKKLGRTNNAVKIMVSRLGLGAFLGNGDYITYNELLKALGSGGDSYKAISWIKNRQFPVHIKRVNNCKFRVVYIEEFWTWAEKHQSFIDFSDLEINILGKEPKWVKDKRTFDYHKKRNYKFTPWTKAEDNRLKRMLKEYRYTYDDLTGLLQRTAGAIQRRIVDLNLRERPLKADNHAKWTDKENTTLNDLIKRGATYEFMAEKLGKSSKAIRGKVYRKYGTENLDKARYSIA